MLESTPKRRKIEEPSPSPLPGPPTLNYSPTLASSSSILNEGLAPALGEPDIGEVRFLFPFLVPRKLVFFNTPPLR